MAGRHAIVYRSHNHFANFLWERENAKGVLTDGTVVDLNQQAEWVSKDTDMIYADQGRILALMPGETQVEVLYGSHSQTIDVIVKKAIDIAYIIDELNAYQLMANSGADATAIGKEMVEYQWTPTSNMRGWRDGKTFYANQTYTGIPYSQTANQVDKSGFASAMNQPDFYDDYTRFSIIMPKYGNDCPGFVSFCWGISRKTTSDFVNGIKDGTYTKVGTYNADNPTLTSLKTSYRNLSPGNAVVKSGHTFLIASNDRTSKVYVYEQTPYTAVYTSWTYDDLANAGYMPFKN